MTITRPIPRYAHKLNGGQEMPRTPEGVPFLEHPGPMTKADIEQVRYGGRVHVREFDLSDPTQLLQYTAVRQRVMDTLAIQLRPIKEVRNKEDTGWKVLIEWADLYAIPPQKDKLAEGA